MGSLKNILIQCQEHEKEYEKHGINPDDPGRLVNKGWIECSKFFLSNFYLTEKTITEEREIE